MRTFKDKEGKEWVIDLNLALIKRMESYDYSECYKEERISFLPPQEDLFTEVVTNPAINFTMVWVCCQEQAEKIDVKTEMDFASRFNGETLQTSRLAMMEELPPFFPEQRMSLEALTQKYSKILMMADKKIGKMIEEKLGDEELENLMEEGVIEVAKSLDEELLKAREGFKNQRV